jgi:predicted DNA-binding transcriptional regulator YafY
MGSDDERLERWHDADQVTVQTSRDPLARLLLEACRTGDGVDIIYFGGTTPGESRVICPRRLFKVKGFDSIYVEAYCRTRGENRNFRLDKIKLAHPTYSTAQRFQPTTPKQPPQTPVSTGSGTGCLMYVVAGILSVLTLLLIVFRGI